MAELLRDARLRFATLGAGTLIRKDVELALFRLTDQLKNPTHPVASMILSPGFRGLVGEIAAQGPAFGWTRGSKTERWLRE